MTHAGLKILQQSYPIGDHQSRLSGKIVLSNGQESPRFDLTQPKPQARPS
jgi:hypothetical protein